MFEYALGSARESRDWYLQGRHVIGDDARRVSLELLSRVVKLLLAYIPMPLTRQP